MVRSLQLPAVKPNMHPRRSFSALPAALPLSLVGAMASSLFLVACIGDPVAMPDETSPGMPSSLSETNGAGDGGSCSPPVGALASWSFEDNLVSRVGSLSFSAAGATTFAAGREGHAVQLASRTSLTVNVPEGATKPSGYSLDGWVEIDSTKESGPSGGPSKTEVDSCAMATVMGMFTLRSEKDGRISVVIDQSWILGTLRDAVLTSPDPIPQGSLTHVAVVIEGAALRFYVGGALAREVMTLPISPRTRALALGSKDCKESTVKVDELTVYSRSISQAEVTGLANLAAGAACSN